jgi:hypothetical protein
VGLRTRKDAAEGASEGAQLVVRGEDVLTQLTHAIVCLLRVRLGLADQAAMLGYVPRIVALMAQSVGQPARYNLGIQALRVLQVFAPSKACVAALGKANACNTLLRILEISPLPRDAAFMLEALKAILETDSQDFHVLVEASLRCGIIGILIRVLEKDKLDHLVDPSAAKVHAVSILKTLENDMVHGPGAAAQLEAAHGESWNRYKHQKHDLFLSKNDTRDYFLTDAGSSAPAFMLKNSAEWSAAASSGGGGGGGGFEPPSSATEHGSGGGSAYGGGSVYGGSRYGAAGKAGAALSYKKPPPPAPAPAAAAGTGKKAIKALKKAAATEAISIAPPEHLELKARLDGKLRKDSLACLACLCAHDGGEQTLLFRPILAMLEALQDEKFLTFSLSKAGELLVKGVQSETSQRIHKPRKENEAIMLNSVAFLRRILVVEHFPLSLFAD